MREPLLDDALGITAYRNPSLDLVTSKLHALLQRVWCASSHLVETAMKAGNDEFGDSDNVNLDDITLRHL
jgi:hypothetical protein